MSDTIRIVGGPIDGAAAARGVTPPGRGAASTVRSSPGGSGQGKAVFDDVFDAVNPVQHLPIISSAYRADTGDGIGQVPRLVGGMFYGGILGGPAGVVGAVADLLVEKATGRDMETQMLGTVGKVIPRSDPWTVVAPSVPDRSPDSPTGERPYSVYQGPSPSEQGGG
ncbi:MAG: hypothetical protein HQL59_03870 [Magnetococcales bacterium]|nr:hypothetical protein [Magnetococcales bacterium]